MRGSRMRSTGSWRSPSSALAKLGASYGDVTGIQGLGIDTSNMGGNVYAYSADGDTYTIGTEKGQSFIASAAPGQTMTGGDGSVWTKNADGSVTISKGGKVYTIAAAQAAAPAYYYNPTTDNENEKKDNSKTITSASQLGSRARYVYNTVMSNIAAGASANSMMQFVLDEIDGGQITDESEKDFLLSVFGY